MRALLISPNKERVPDPVFPLGLAYVSAGLIRGGHEVSVLDLIASDDIREEVREAVSGFRPEVVGVSLRNIDDVSYPKGHSYLSEYREVMAALRESSDAPVVLGGSGFTIMPMEFMRELKADYGIAGEGERAFPALLKGLKGSKYILRRLQKDGDGRGPVVRAGRISSLDGLMPERALFDTELYYRLGGMLNIQTKRGCGFKCSYCTYPKVEGAKVRAKSPEAVADELEETVSSTGVRHFFVVDSVFNSPPSHAAAVCREIIRRGLDIKWSCYSSPTGMTPKLAELMARAGCTGVELGSDSLSDEGLRALGKSFTYDKIKKASKMCKEAGLKSCHFIFIGAPGDTVGRVEENFHKLDELDPDAAVLMAGIRVFPGTGLAGRAKEELGIETAGLGPVFYISPGVLGRVERLAEEASKRRNWAMPGFEINIYERLQRKLRESGIKGPLWEGLSAKRVKC